MKRTAAIGALLVLWASLFAAGPARAADDDASVFAAAVQSLKEGRPGDAIAQLEALADRGVVDPVASYDRGLAYANRVRVGGEQPGDLGRAAHGFEEAKELTSDPALGKDAGRALTMVRAEVARRRARAGDPVELEQGTPLGRAITELLPEGAWALIAALGSVALGLALFVRASTATRRTRVGATLACAIAAPMLLGGAVLALAARSDRLHLREGIVVSPSVRPADERGVVLSGQQPLPEATRVQIEDEKPGWARVRWGAVVAWIPAPSVRPLARLD
jgi:hypothetical protein